ncbi:NAD(P)-dependent oxidoreductase [Enterococcus sp. LJL51]|uniref:NAD(P)-dependent oxidoreductase n=1 Tax=Enterococcus sp. LJL51 TaxID=3416656 RepID=UPI003CF4ED10
MKIAVLGGNGKAGSLIIQEAEKRGFQTTAIVRDKNKVGPNQQVIEKDVYSLTREDVKDFDVLVCALGFWGNVEEFSISMKHLIGLLAGLPTRLLVVGGAGSLYLNADRSQQLKDTLPDEYKTVPIAMGESLQLLKESKGVNWTYISPAQNFDAKGDRTGKYFAAGDTLTKNAEGKSYISYADYALAMVDEIENKNYPNQQMSVYS